MERLDMLWLEEKIALLRVKMDDELASWDEIVEEFEKTFGKTRITHDYWQAYKLCENGDIDGGECGVKRTNAMNRLFDFVEGVEGLLKKLSK